MAKVILQLGDLTCPSCMTKIRKAVENQDGVSDVKVLFNAGKVKANIDQAKVTGNDLSSVITDLGYEVKKVKTKELA
ncbi:heavy-metal-associated domain-containing protein [Companilactobacillus futsaii]|uniref:Heavy-metal-associated domain-containing protein n=2 Tax=Companilactobacillus futsaii TaxID=938155 RepID=A0A5B7T0F8_9LACO|nr:heavy-metal-associated domain-containing protein [Companilactobacillus futsaii]QCX23701.1 heavy-metal-associated domain-containing protein [Companilactobacillus futsaii]